jgi:hypothetical protein
VRRVSLLAIAFTCVFVMPRVGIRGLAPETVGYLEWLRHLLCLMQLDV